MADSRLQALKQLKLKTVIKVESGPHFVCYTAETPLVTRNHMMCPPLLLQESHCSPVQDLSMNMCDAQWRNLFATVAKDQVSSGCSTKHYRSSVVHLIKCGNKHCANRPWTGSKP
jgi:hypothetical protein